MTPTQNYQFWRFQRVRLKRARRLWCECRRLNYWTADIICQRSHKLPGAAAAATLLSRKHHLYRNEMWLLGNGGGWSSQHNCQPARSICLFSVWLCIALRAIVRSHQKTPLTFGGQPALRASKKDTGKQRPDQQRLKSIFSSFFFQSNSVSLLQKKKKKGSKINQNRGICCHIDSYIKSLSDCFQCTSSPAKHDTFYHLGKWERANKRPEKSTL